MAIGKKGEAQRLRVIESASYCLTQFGERGATFQAIADHCGLSQASVVKYLKSRDNIFPLVLDHWMSRARKITEESLQKAGTPEEKLRNYLRLQIQLFFEKPDVNKTYLMLHYFAGIDERHRLMNAQIKEIARARLADILTAGVKDGSFREMEVPLMARTIHNNLVGYLLSSVTEPTKPSDLQLPKTLEDSCLYLVLNRK
jgi:AcrR family transcriptional regulator